jgi:hypothetical protein
VSAETREERKIAASASPQQRGLAEKQTMRNGQNKRMRGRNRKGGHHQNPLSRVYESNGPDVKIRGTASHIAEKYLQLARDALSSGDPVAAENYYQHAEHYFRLIAAAQEQFRQSQPFYQQGGEGRGPLADDGYEEGESEQPSASEPFAPREPQPYYPREHQQSQPQTHNPQPRAQHGAPANDEDVERLPSFITGGGQPLQQAPPAQAANGPNGPNAYDGAADRFPLHRRRRRHRGGPRDHVAQGEGDSPAPAAAPRPFEE